MKPKPTFLLAALALLAGSAFAPPVKMKRKNLSLRKPRTGTGTRAAS